MFHSKFESKKKKINYFSNILHKQISKTYSRNTDSLGKVENKVYSAKTQLNPLKMELVPTKFLFWCKTTYTLAKTSFKLLKNVCCP